MKDFKWHRAQRSPNWSTFAEAIAAAEETKQGKQDGKQGQQEGEDGGDLVALADRCRALLLWEAPAAAACLGFANALTPAPVAAAPLVAATTPAGEDDDEDEL